MATLFSDFLTQLRVRHTEDYSDRRFFAMPFQSMFGLTKLLQEYKINTQGVKAADKSLLGSFHTPFLADTPDGFVIVTDVTTDTVDYITQSRPQSAPTAEFADAWNGIALLATTTLQSCEPDYQRHHLDEVFNVVKAKALWIFGVVLAAIIIFHTGLYHSWAGMLAAVIDAVGVYVSFMLVQKSLNIKNAKADAVCSVLEEGGCDTIAKSEASSFLGIVKWSEVGLAYFSVSLLAVILFPAETLYWLAFCNVLCLPYTVWSITYQKFVAKTWCTLCVTVQALLWLLFVTYLVGGAWHGFSFDLFGETKPQLVFVALVCTYAVALLAINRFDNALSRLLHPVNPLTDNDNGNSDTINR